MSRRNYKLDFLKFIFSIVVVFYHSRHLQEGVKYPFEGGYLAVDFFFIVSGYWFCASVEKNKSRETTSIGRDTLTFIAHKTGGLFPNYAVAWLVSLMVKLLLDSRMTNLSLVNKFDCVWELLLVRQFGLGESYFVNGATWYLSTMLIVMFVLYPIYRKNHELFMYVIAPLLACFTLGVMYQNFSHLKGPSEWLYGVVYKGVIRGTADICLGCLVYSISCKIKEYSFREHIRIIGLISEIIIYSGLLYCIFEYKSSKMDFVWVFLMSTALVLTLSNIPAEITIINKSRGCCLLLVWLGDFSYSLFLAQSAWCQTFNSITIMKGLDYYQQLPYFLIVVFATALLIMYLSRGIKKFWVNNKKKIISIVLEQ